MTNPVEVIRQATGLPFMSEAKCRKIFLAVLESIREPSEGVVVATEQEVLNRWNALPGPEWQRLDGELIWKAALDALIHEQGGLAG
jgi:hypothetical protein